jgi:hypothetical protein
VSSKKTLTASCEHAGGHPAKFVREEDVRLDRDRLQSLDWSAIDTALDRDGFARAGVLLDPDECAALAGLYDEQARFRKTVEMERHRFGAGQYRYFARPLPSLVQRLRSGLYRRLAPAANRWSGWLGREERFPPSLRGFLERCERAGQTRPTPLLLRYGEGGYNCLHRDLYGEVAFPLQGAVLLSRPGVDYAGGEFLLVEQRPRAQSIGHALALEQGELVIFATAERPAPGARGPVRASMRHGVSRIERGERFTLGLILHDAS